MSLELCNSNVVTFVSLSAMNNAPQIIVKNSQVLFLMNSFVRANKKYGYAKNVNPARFALKQLVTIFYLVAHAFHTLTLNVGE